MVLPDYKNSIVNLMSSIQAAYGIKSRYSRLKQLDVKELSSKKNIVLMVFDGLGYDYVVKQGKGSIFEKYLKSKITSVFPSTTATAITSFYTGKPAQQHSITGWFMYAKEVGGIIANLPFMMRGGYPLKINPKKIFTEKPIFDKLKADSYVIMHEPITFSEYNNVNTGKAKKIPYNDISSFFSQTKKVILSSNRKKFIHAYWPFFDGFCHHYGKKSKKTYKHFLEMEKGLKKFISSIKGTNTEIIITADHGQIDVDKSKRLNLKDHPKLADTLTLPLSGEPRVVYCYVRSDKTKQFENYVKTRLKDMCEIHKSKELIEKNYYGLFKPSKKLYERIGDYVLIMKENYILLDFLIGEEREFLIGNHGGISEEEMYVPLIYITC